MGMNVVWMLLSATSIAFWLLVAIGDSYINEKNLFHLFDIVEERHDRTSAHNWELSPRNGSSGLLSSPRWVDEFSFEQIHANSDRYTLGFQSCPLRKHHSIRSSNAGYWTVSSIAVQD
jgi:hypothetical protein